MADAIFLGILALADLGFLIFLRTLRGRQVRQERVEECLTLYVRRENGYQAPKRRRLQLLKAN